MLSLRSCLLSFGLNFWIYFCLCFFFQYLECRFFLLLCLCCYSIFKLCITLWDFMDYSPPGSTLHGICQARILKWASIFFSQGSYGYRDQVCISCLAGRFFTTEPGLVILPTQKKKRAHDFDGMIVSGRKKSSSVFLGFLGCPKSKLTWERLTGENQTKF